MLRGAAKAGCCEFIVPVANKNIRWQLSERLSDVVNGVNRCVVRLLLFKHSCLNIEC